MSTPLSPAAQAVRRDLAQIIRELHQRCRVSISATDALPITLEANDSSLQAGIDSLIAAALRAAADQVVPEIDEPDWGACDEMWCDIELYTDHQRKRAALLAIAAELDPPTP